MRAVSTWAQSGTAQIVDKSKHLIDIGLMTERVTTVRRFNRMYTRQIGLLNEAFLGSAYSLGEMRVLYELAHRTRPTATEIGKSLGLDLGYLSRVLRRFEQTGLPTKIPSESDARQSLLELTRKGKKEVAALEA